MGGKHAPPGELHFQRGPDQLQPFQLIRELAAGKLTGQAWRERAQALGIEGLRVAPNEPPDTAKALSA